MTDDIKRESQSRIPRLSGQVNLPGLRDEVQVVRDIHGVPHIWAGNVYDVLFAQGYVHAQDRLWQMEVRRRFAAGKLAEVFGPNPLEGDRLARKIGFARAAHVEWSEADDAYRGCVEPYVEGINAFLESAEPLPIEFHLLEFRPEPWTPVDVVTINKQERFSVSINYQRKIAHWAMLRSLGKEYFSRLFPWYPTDAPVIVPPGQPLGKVDWETSITLNAGEASNAIKPADWDTSGSNNFAVDGTMTGSGAPLVANDPHLVPSAPGPAYFCHLVCPQFEAIGDSRAGQPGITSAGHNGRVAWSQTNANVDTQDLFLERVHWDEPPRYLFRDEWLPLRIHREKILIKGDPNPVVDVVYETHHGPIVSGGPGEDGPVLALSWVGMEPSQNLAGMVARHQAGDVFEMIEAQRDLSAGSNRVFADTSGNIAYLLRGRLPRRAGGPAHVPMPGWTGEHEWEGWVPFDEMPKSINPESHFINTSNNLVVGPSFPHYVSVYGTSSRAWRIGSLLRERGPHNMRTFMRIQTDIYSLPGHLLAQRAAKSEPSSDRGRFARDQLEKWDGNLEPESPGAAVCKVLTKVMYQRIAREFVESLEEPRPTEVDFRQVVPLERLCHVISGDEDLFLDKLSYQSWEELLALALDEAAAILDEQLPSERWAWGELHRVEFRHPGGRDQKIGESFNLGPYEVGGDGTSAFNTLMGLSDYGAVGFPAYRQIIDLADVSRSVFVAPPGQSGHLGSDHYGDHIEDFFHGRFRPLLWEWNDIEANGETRLVLHPAVSAQS